MHFEDAFARTGRLWAVGPRGYEEELAAGEGFCHGLARGIDVAHRPGNEAYDAVAGIEGGAHHFFLARAHCGSNDDGALALAALQQVVLLLLQLRTAGAAREAYGHEEAFIQEEEVAHGFQAEVGAALRTGLGMGAGLPPGKRLPFAGACRTELYAEHVLQLVCGA